jgi:DNA polymerase
MRLVRIQTFDQWRYHARLMLEQEIPPTEVAFGRSDTNQLRLNLDPRDQPGFEPPRSRTLVVAHVPRQFLNLARTVACHRDERRWELLYRTLWRLTHGERHLLEIATDDDILRLRRLEAAVARDARKAQAFIRFRRIVDRSTEHFVAWHRPEYRILRLVAPFFSRCFPNMLWTILTPDESVKWDLHQLRYGAGVPAGKTPIGEQLESLWRIYDRSIFNRARIKLKTMTPR